MMRHKENTSKL